jgi:hypothetical protein
MERVGSVQLTQNDVWSGDLEISDDALVWGCKVEWFEDGDGTEDDVAQLVNAPLWKSTVQSGVPNETKVLKEGVSPSQPLKFLPKDKRHDNATGNFHMEEDHLKLIFEVRGEVVDLKFRVE